jgi:hypothetical protein
VLTVLALLGLYEGFRLIRVSLAVKDPLGPGWYLLFISLALWVCGLAYLVAGLKKRSETVRGRFSIRLGPVLQCSILLVLYCLLMVTLGYLVSTLLFFLTAIPIFGMKSWKRDVAMSLAFTAAFYFIFSYLAGLTLP